VVVSKSFYFHSYLGKSSNLTSIFFRWPETTNYCSLLFTQQISPKKKTCRTICEQSNENGSDLGFNGREVVWEVSKSGTLWKDEVSKSGAAQKSEVFFFRGRTQGWKEHIISIEKTEMKLTRIYVLKGSL